MFFVRQNYVFCLLKFNAYRMNLVQASQNNRKRPKIRKKKNTDWKTYICYPSSKGYWDLKILPWIIENIAQAQSFLNNGQ